MNTTTAEPDAGQRGDLRRFYLGTREGEDISYPSSLTSIPRFAVGLSAASSLPHSRIIQGTMVPLSLPSWSQPRWADVDPEALRCPLFWIPQSKIERRSVIASDQDGEQLEVPEDDDLRALRLALELTQSGLYTAEEGWVDMLYAVGIDVLTDSGRDQVRAWQEGGDDPALDQLSTSAYTDPLEEDEDDEWAFAVACQLYPLWRSSCWADLAFWMVTELIAQLPEAGDVTGMFNRRLHSVSSLAAIMLSECPEADPEQLQRIDEQAKELDAPGGSLERGIEVRSTLMATLYDVYDAHADSTFQMRQLNGVDLNEWNPLGEPDEIESDEDVEEDEDGSR